jgi:hypothetical protein
MANDTKKHAKNSGVSDHTDPEAALLMTNPDAMPDFSGWEEEQLAFPPYLNMEPPSGDFKGSWFHALVITLDDRDPQFPRYVLQAATPLHCLQGKKEEQVDVLVKSGEFFTVSTYSGLPLERYVGVHVLVKCIGTRKVDQPQPMKVFQLKVSPEDKKLLMEDRKTAAREAMLRFRESRKSAPQLTQGNAVASAASA